MPSEPASTMQDIPREVIALLPIPDVKDMTDGQTRGATCVWGDEQLHSSTAIDLGEHLAPMEGSTSTQGVRLFLRACGACTRRAVLRALHAHAPTCEQCVDDAVRCPEGAGLRRLMREARR